MNLFYFNFFLSYNKDLGFKLSFSQIHNLKNSHMLINSLIHILSLSCIHINTLSLSLSHAYTHVYTHAPTLIQIYIHEYSLSLVQHFVLKYFQFLVINKIRALNYIYIFSFHLIFTIYKVIATVTTNINHENYLSLKYVKLLYWIANISYNYIYAIFILKIISKYLPVG